MGVFKFKKDEGTQAPHSNVVRILRFDCSPQFAVSKEYGYPEKFVELRNQRRDKSLDLFEVYAKRDEENSKFTKIGELWYKAPTWPGGPSMHF